MPLRVKHWLAIPFRWLFQEHKTRGDHRSGVRTRARLEARACEALEGRVVLSGWDNSLAESLTNVGVVVTPIVAADRPNDPSAGRDAPLAQLQADEQALQAELHGLAAKSRATVADLGNLDSDSRTFAQAGY